MFAGFCNAVRLFKLAERGFTERVDESRVALVERTEICITESVPHQQDTVPTHFVVRSSESLKLGRHRPDANRFRGEITGDLVWNPGVFELFCIFRILRYLNDETPGLRLHPIDGESTALAQLETDDRRIAVYHDQNGAINFHEPLDPTVAPTHPMFKRYQDALVDYTNALRELTGSDQDPALY